MKVIRNDEVAKQDATDAPLFFGGKVFRQPLVSDGASKYFSFNMVGFAAGARNKFHTHTSDQILYVTKGTGIVATESEEATVNEGDTILIPAGEPHVTRNTGSEPLMLLCFFPVSEIAGRTHQPAKSLA